MSPVKHSKLVVVTNHYHRADTDIRNSGLNPDDLRIICTVHRLLDLPDGAKIVIKDYYDYAGQTCVCKTAKLMVKRGNFQEVEL